MDDVQLSDLTSYPFSFDNNQILDIVKPYPLIQKKANSKIDQKLRFSFTKYKENFISNRERVDKFLTFEGGDLEIVYQ